MNTVKYLIAFLAVVVFIQCDNKNNGGDDDILPITTGVLEIDFKMPTVPLPDNKIHRMELVVARTYDSLYKGLIVASANVMDSKSLYRFVLTPGTYYYEAGITCSCLADSCLWGGFPGGRYGVRRTTGKAEVKLGEVIRDSPLFQ